MTKSLNMAPTLIVAILGEMCGITLSYASRGSESFLSRFSFAAKGLEKAANGSSVSAVGH